MRISVTILIFFACANILLAQEHLEVDGSVKIKDSLAIGDHTASQVLDARGPNPDAGALLLLGNSDLSHKLLLFPGHENDPLPFIQWKEGDPLRFGTDEGSFSEKLRIESDGTLIVFNRIANIADPVDGRDAATKAYVDKLILEIDWLKGLLGIGEVTDDEGNVYPTVQIGAQLWMAKNLNIGVRIAGSSGQNNNATIEKFCYNDLESNCDKYGGLYMWDEAMKFESVGMQGICPSGWHIPLDSEFDQLRDFLDAGAILNNNIAGGKMKEAGFTHWNSPNSGANNGSHFTGLPGGILVQAFPAEFRHIGTRGSFWSSLKHDASGSFSYELNHDEKSLEGFISPRNSALSVRCIMD